jgi:hypothetical protein
MRDFFPLNFILGVAKILDIGSTLRVYQAPRLKIPQATFFRDDAKALEADWCAVGDDLRSAIAEFQEQHAEIS